MNYNEKILIAANFEEFIRAMGTGQYAVWKKREKDFIELMNGIVAKESLIFWKSLVGFYD